MPSRTPAIWHRFALPLLAGTGMIMLAALPARSEVVWGANGHPLVTYPGTPLSRQLAYMRDLGLKSYRVDVRESDVERLVGLVAEAGASGVEVLPVLTPAFDLDKETPETLHTKAYAFAADVVSRLKAHVRVFELGNEMENYAIIKPCEMQDDGVQYSCSYGLAGGTRTLDYYAPRWRKVSAVLKGLSEGAVHGDPTALKAMGTAGWGHTGAFQRMHDDGIVWDISVWHLYGADPEWALKDLQRFGHPIWITEFNHPRGSSESEAAEALGVVRWMRRIEELAGRYRIEAAHIYELLDEPYWSGDEAAMGLVNIAGSASEGWRPSGEKPAYRAVKAYTRTADAAGGPPSLAIASNQEQPIKRGCDLAAFNGLKTPSQIDRMAYLYCLVLGRRPDGAGLRGFQDQMRAGRSIEDVALEMLQSAEFVERHPTVMGSPAAFIGLLTRVLLERPADPTFVSAIAMRLQSGSLSRPHLIRMIMESAEFKERHGMIFGQRSATTDAKLVPPEPGPGEALRNCDLVEIARAPLSARTRVSYGYCLVMGRDADGAGIADYSAAVGSGMSTVAFLKALAGSEEFARRPALLGTSDSEYVARLYRLLLDREPDKTGLDTYLAALRAGRTGRSDIAAAIIDSAEFKNRHTALFIGG